MSYPVKNGQTSVVLRFKLLDSASGTGAGKTGLTNSSTALIISTIADNEATAVAYTQAGSTIQTITTLGTYAAPSASNCRFKEVDSVNHPGVYEFQFADARFAVSSAKSLLISVSGVAGLAQCDYGLALISDDPYVAKPTNSSLLSIDGSGRIDVGKILGTASAGAAGSVGIDWAHVANPTTAVGLTGTTISSSQVVASVTGAVGSVTGAVGSVTGAVGSVTGNVGGNVVGSVASVTGAVGSVTGNVGGNVVGSVASVTGNVGGNVVGSVASVVGNLGGNVGGNILGVVNDLTVTTRAEPGQATPSATVTPATKLDYLYKLFLNQKTQTATTFSLYNNAGAVVDQKSTVSDDGTTATRGNIVSGP